MYPSALAVRHRTTAVRQSKAGAFSQAAIRELAGGEVVALAGRLLEPLTVDNILRTALRHCCGEPALVFPRGGDVRSTSMRSSGFSISGWSDLGDDKS
jgi:hypothetical protein